MHQAIVTTWFGPSGIRGTRVRAQCQACSLWWNWDHALNAERNHIAAAWALARKMKWEGVWRGGALHKGGEYAFVCTSDDDERSVFIVPPEKKDFREECDAKYADWLKKSGAA